MNKIISVAVLFGVVAAPAFAAPSYIARDGRGGYNVTYSYQDKAKSGWYLTGRAEVSMLNWKNKYSTTVGVSDSDKFSFEPVFGGSVAGGHRFNHFWRGEIEGGYIGYYDDTKDGTEFSISLPYLMANGYYDFTNGLYVGAGIGAAMPITKLEAYTVDAGDVVKMTGDSTKTHLSAMGGLMFGWARKLDDNLVLDLRYRLAGITGVKQTRGVSVADVEMYKFKNKINFIMDNSISLGIRYEF